MDHVEAGDVAEDVDVVVLVDVEEVVAGRPVDRPVGIEGKREASGITKW